MSISPIREDVSLEVILKLCERINTPRSLGVYLLIKHKDFLSLANLNIDPSSYLTPEQFEKDYFVTEFLSKYKGLDTGLDLDAVALRTWIDSEAKCALTNKRIRSGLRDSTSRVHAVLHRAQRKISQILGPLKKQDVLRGCEWSSGATFDLRRGASLAQRISNGVSVTRSAAKYLRLCIETDPVWFEAVSGFYPSGPVSLLPSAMEIVEGNRFMTVPKTSKTNRAISAEPTGNAFLQQGVRTFLRKRLMKFGIDLSNQTANADAAALCESLGWATVDLKGASDTISVELVYHLLPIDWFVFLDELRSKKTRISGKWITLEKFSSMGNAFTFELETLIFYALSKSIEDELGVESLFRTPLVYGDDIVVHKECELLLLEVFNDVGFEINQRKSFFSGCFYESCGRHYFQGRDVTPRYQKEIADTREELIRLHNRLFRFWNPRRLYWKTVCSYVLQTFNKFGDKHAIPRIPRSCPDDDGFLSYPSELGRYDHNHGFRCVVYHNCPVLSKVRKGLPFYAYKLRKSSYHFPDPKGQQSVIKIPLRYRYDIVYRHDWGDAQRT